MITRQNQRLSEIAVNISHDRRRVDSFFGSDTRHSSALLLSPWPERVLAYEPAWSPLAQTTHLVAIDVPAFDRSERTDMLMSPRARGDFIVRTADAFGLDHPHRVGPDVGTAAALFAAAAQLDSSLTDQRRTA